MTDNRERIDQLSPLKRALLALEREDLLAQAARRAA